MAKEPEKEFSMTEESEIDYCVKIHSDRLCEIYKSGKREPDSLYARKNMIYCYCSPLSAKSAKNAFLMDVLHKYLSSLNWQDDDTTLGENNGCVTVAATWVGLQIRYCGPDANGLTMMKATTAKIAALKCDSSVLAYIKDIVNECKERSRDPEKLSQDVLTYRLVDNYYTDDLKYESSNDVNLKTVQTFLKRLIKHAYVKVLFQHNYQSDAIIENVRDCIEILKCRAVSRDALPVRKVDVMCKGVTRRTIIQGNFKKPGTIVVTNFYQYVEDNIKTSILIELLITIIEAEDFKHFRNYHEVIPFEGCYALSNPERCGYSIVAVKYQKVLITMPAEIAEAIDEYRSELHVLFQNLPAPDWERIKEIYNKMLNKRNVNQFESHWREIETSAYTFDRWRRQCNVYKELSIAELKDSMVRLTCGGAEMARFTMRISSFEFPCEGNVQQAESDE